MISTSKELIELILKSTPAIKRSYHKNKTYMKNIVLVITGFSVASTRRTWTRRGFTGYNSHKGISSRSYATVSDDTNDNKPSSHHNVDPEIL